MFVVALCVAVASVTMLLSSQKEDKPAPSSPPTQTPHDNGTYDQGDRRGRDLDPKNDHGDCTGNVPIQPWQGTSK